MVWSIQVSVNVHRGPRFGLEVHVAPAEPEAVLPARAGVERERNHRPVRLTEGVAESCLLLVSEIADAVVVLLQEGTATLGWD